MIHPHIGGNMKGLFQLWSTVASECAAVCRVDATKDIDYVLSRIESEGFSFLTITLTNFGKAFERSLAKGSTSSDSLCVRDEPFAGFKRRTNGSGMPHFLGGFLGLIFDPRDGVLLEEPDVEAIRAIRQLTLMFGKILLPCSDARVEAAFNNYLECEQELIASDKALPSGFLEDFKQASLLLWGDAMQQVDEDIYYGRIIPKHGPGSTADRLVANAKWDQLEWTERLEKIFPFGEYLIPNSRYHVEYLPLIKFLEPGAERPVKVITVPKTLKTPRIIAIEPTCMQYMQQGIARSLVPRLEMSKSRKGILGFTDQSDNHRMARIGSITGRYATFDLSEASDRVSNQLVRAMTCNFPNLSEGIDACRSRSADVNGKVIRLTKFASMGSALTFPVEAMVFSTICFMGIAQAKARPLTEGLIQEFRRSVRVYGDDIIVPTDCALWVKVFLETFGFKVNTSKSFTEGNFRESCGKEFFKGDDVSVCRVRRELPCGPEDVREILSLASFRNQAYWLGLWQTAKYCDDILEKVLNGHYPIVEATSSLIGRESIIFPPESVGIDEDTHQPVVKGWFPKIKTPERGLDGVGALMKCLLLLEVPSAGVENQPNRLVREVHAWSGIQEGSLPAAQAEHLVRSGRPLSVRMKRGWRRPF
jgi:hypothetical protein